MESNSHPRFMSSIVVSSRSAPTLMIDLQPVCSPVLISDSDLLKQCRVTHTLDACSHVFISSSDLLKHSKATHTLDVCSTVHISGSSLKHKRANHIVLYVYLHVIVNVLDLIKHCRATYILNPCSHILSVVKIHLNTAEQLTP